MNKNNPNFIKELETGYAVLGDNQFYKGYCVFLCKHPVLEPHNLPEVERKKFLFETTLLGEAIWKAFSPAKLNYATLGNADRHLHTHIFPRYEDDPYKTTVVWKNPDFDSKPVTLNAHELDELKLQILKYL